MWCIDTKSFRFKLFWDDLKQGNCTKISQSAWKRKTYDVITLCSIKVGTHEVTNCSNMSQRQIASCLLENFCEIFVSATEFCHSNMLQKIKSDRNCATATCCKKSNQTEIVRLVAATKFCCSDKDFHKISPVHMKRFVAAMCHHNMLLQLVPGPVHTERSVTATCCCNLSPSVYQP